MNLVSTLKEKKSIKLYSESGKVTTSKELFFAVDKNTEMLLSMGIKKSDTLAIVLENSTNFVSAFLSVINCCISAPLNPSYSEAEFDFFYSDLLPKAIITNFDDDHPCIKVAKKKKIKIIFVSSHVFKNENFNLKIKKSALSIKSIALILHTSGTTSRPKMVALSHTNLLESAKNIASTLKLSKADKNIILMPSFHIHGIVASILAPLSAGSSLVVLSKFNALTFFKNLKLHKPTWFTAVPTMLQSILDRAQKNKAIIKNSKLRFIRSSSASLPITILEELEKVFKVPVIESYGMTEAAHQMTTNLLPPKKRKIGSVGVPFGLKVRVVDKKLKACLPFKEGEIVIKGKSVFKTYLAKKEVNKKAFSAGWFKTGDIGYIDNDGYLFISGRIKEIINRGGEKISPKEVDEAFMKHHKVDKAVAFSVKHKKLGEDISLAIVLKSNKKCDATELKEYAKDKLAPFKIPRKIYFVKKIPVGSTGKLQRIGLSKKLGIES